MSEAVNEPPTPGSVAPMVVVYNTHVPTFDISFVSTPTYEPVDNVSDGEFM